MSGVGGESVSGVHERINHTLPTLLEHSMRSHTFRSSSMAGSTPAAAARAVAPPPPRALSAVERYVLCHEIQHAAYVLAHVHIIALHFFCR